MRTYYSYSSNQIIAIIKLLADKKVSSKRLNVLLASGILADVFDADADYFGRREVRAALKLDPLSPKENVQQMKLRLTYAAPTDVEAHEEVFKAIEATLEQSLLKLANDEAQLREKVATLDLKPMRNRLYRAGVVNEISADTCDVKEMREEMVEYMLAYHSLCLIQGFPLLPFWHGTNLFKLLPDFDGDLREDETKLRQWVMTKLQTYDLSVERTRILFNQLGLE